MMPAFASREALRVPLLDAAEQFLAETQYSRFDLPAFNNSAMDGYAVRAEELRGASASEPVELPVSGESRAGGAFPGALPHGSAYRIFTGAPLPEGADAVVAQEDAERRGDRVAFLLSPATGAHVRPRGNDCRAGELLLQAGAELGAGEIALLASQGICTLPVHRRPVVSILSTGDELRDLGEPLVPGTLVNTNAPTLAVLVRQAGGIPRIYPTSGDDLDETEARLRKALGADLVVTTGGVSVGEYDVVREAFERIGVEASFWKIAVKPGKPVSFGRHAGVPIVGLPGNPVSAWVTFELFVRPGVRRMLGDPRPYARLVDVELGSNYRRSSERTELVRARLDEVGGKWVATLHRLQGSGSLPSMVGVDALVVVPADQAEVKEGSTLKALLLRDRLGSADPPVYGGRAVAKTPLEVGG